MNKILILLFVTLALTACGVKSSPQPPEIAAPIGTGEPKYFQKEMKSTIKKRILKEDDPLQDDEETEEPAAPKDVR